MNKIFLSGRLCNDPEMRKTQSGIDVTNFRLAVDRPGTRKENRLTDYFNCTVWGGKEGPGRAGVIQHFFHKGDGITINGPMTTREYQDKDTGKKITSYEVQVDDFEFPLNRKQDAAQPAQPTQAATAPAGFTPVESNEELPF